MKYRAFMIIGYRKELTVYGDNEEEAIERAKEICEDWNNVASVELEDIKEHDQ